MLVPVPEQEEMVLVVMVEELDLEHQVVLVLGRLEGRGLMVIPVTLLTTAAVTNP